MKKEIGIYEQIIDELKWLKNYGTGLPMDSLPANFSGDFQDRIDKMICGWENKLSKLKPNPDYSYLCGGCEICKKKKSN